MDGVWCMIPIYNIEDLTIELVDSLVERGVVFDVTSKTSVLSKGRSSDARDAFWGSRDNDFEDIRFSSPKQDNSKS